MFKSIDEFCPMLIFDAAIVDAKSKSPTKCPFTFPVEVISPQSIVPAEILLEVISPQFTAPSSKDAENVVLTP